MDSFSFWCCRSWIYYYYYYLFRSKSILLLNSILYCAYYCSAVLCMHGFVRLRVSMCFLSNQMNNAEELSHISYCRIFIRHLDRFGGWFIYFFCARYKRLFNSEFNPPRRRSVMEFNVEYFGTILKRLRDLNHEQITLISGKDKQR